MPDVRHTFTDLENGIDADTVGVTYTLTEGIPGPRFVLLEAGVLTPPAGTPVGSLIFQKTIVTP